MGFALAEMETLTGSGLATDIVIVFEETGLLPLIQLAFDVIEQLTISPFAGI